MTSLYFSKSRVALAQSSRPSPFLTDSTAYIAPDTSLISELYDAIEQSPPGLMARKLLIQHLMACGYLDTARDAVQELIVLDPADSDAQTWYCMLCYTAEPEEPEETATPALPPPPVQNIIVAPEDVGGAQKDLADGYKALSRDAKTLHWEMSALRDLLHLKWKGKGKGKVKSFEERIPEVEALAKGPLGNTKATQSPGPQSARTVAREMEKGPAKAMDIAIQDLIDMARWLQSPGNQPSEGPLSVRDNDAVREALVKRVQALTSALPRELQPHASTALMHVEHEILQRKYVCNETMLGDPVSDIPRQNFWVSEDGYAWDMEELAQAIAVAGGVMRNPLSRQMFTPADVSAIVKHPLGKQLAALQVEQSQLRKGVRLQTIEHMEKLSAALLADNTPDQLASRHVVDEFLAYIATLPEPEQKAIDGLRVPARDSHTGQAFDSTIGEAVRDAQGNRVCIHKTGDFIGQAARHLRQNR
jgi:hypothetical protein